MTYKVVLHRADEGISVSVPGLPGCWSEGDTEQSLHERIKVVERRLLVDVLAAVATRGVTWTGRKATIG